MLAQYPCNGCIYGNIGEERHNPDKGETPRARYHYGVDFGQANGKDVVAIETGPLRWDQGKTKFAIGTYGYVHVIPNDFLKSKENGYIIQQGTIIGTITSGHLHLQRASTQIYSSPNNTGDIRSIESTNDIDWINYISDIGRSGAATPVIHDAILYRQPTKLGEDITTNPTKLNDIHKLYGKYDILLNSTEKTSLATLAPYKMKYKVNDNSGNVLKDWSGIEFEKVPLKISAKKVMGLKSNHKNKEFEYVITNNPIENPSDRFLNFRKHELYDQTTNWPLKAQYKDGTKIRLWVRSCNENNACDNEMIIPGSTGIYEVDNFQPYIANIDVNYGTDNIYTLKRIEGSLSKENTGFLLNKKNEKAFNPLIFGPVEITIKTSEPMKSMKIGYNLNTETGIVASYLMNPSLTDKNNMDL